MSDSFCRLLLSGKFELGVLVAWQSHPYCLASNALASKESTIPPCKTLSFCPIITRYPYYGRASGRSGKEARPPPHERGSAEISFRGGRPGPG